MKMRHFCVGLICTAFLLPAQAQLSFGPKAGLNIGKISFTSPNFKSSYRVGFYAGGFANYEVTDHWSGQLEVFYSAEGTTEKGVSNTGSGHISEGIIQIPLLAQYHSKMGWYGEAGPQIGILASIREAYTGRPTASIKQYYKSAEFRFPIGAGYEFPSASKVSGLGVNVRYSFSFSQINKSSVGGESLKNSVFSIGAFYKIPVKHFPGKK